MSVFRAYNSHAFRVYIGLCSRVWGYCGAYQQHALRMKWEIPWTIMAACLKVSVPPGVSTAKFLTSWERMWKLGCTAARESDHIHLLLPGS